MREDYRAAKRLADEAVRKAVREGVSPYLPVLDSLEEVKKSVARQRLGVLELPINRIHGNKEAARNNAFANNFMPLLEDGSEFALKWSALYDSYQEEGIRDAIIVFEYMNQYYVQEGNKRVSVSKFGGTDFILADVTRILPQKDNSKEVKVYYEYLDFYKVTGNFLLVFTEPGSYRRLAGFLGQTLEQEWPDHVCLDLKSAYFRFSKCYKRMLDIDDPYAVSDAFLMYLAIFPVQSLLDSSDDLIMRNIDMAKSNLQTSGSVDKIDFLDQAPTEEQKDTSIWSLFTRDRRYTTSDPLRAAFIYDADIESSRWIDSHEAGRLYVEEVVGGQVVTGSYSATHGVSIRDAIRKAIDDGNEMIFAVSPYMLQDVLTASVRYPKVRFLNCTVGYSAASVRCYQGKIYEADFLAGILAASTLLRECPEDPHRIGYLSRHHGSRRLLNLNAFAIGVSMVDPDCRISLRCIKPGEEQDIRKEWKEEGIKIYADCEFAAVSGNSSRPGVYRMVGDRDEFICAPYYTWGRFYAQIIHSVLVGTWNLSSYTDRNVATNYWFGLSAGVVGLRTKELPYPLKKMILAFENAIKKGDLSPYSGEIRAQGGVVIQEASEGTGGKDTLEDMTPAKIIAMDWLNENIDGELT